jgi:hypothetical protein
MIFAYIGPEPAPLLPRWDVLIATDGVRSLVLRVITATYLQTVENSRRQHHFNGFIARLRPALGATRTHFRNYRVRHSRHIHPHSPRRVVHDVQPFRLMPNMNKVGYHLNETSSRFAATH